MLLWSARAPCLHGRLSSNVMHQERAVNVERIFISPAPGAPQVECDRVTVQAGMGIVGDRNYGKSVHPGQNLTLVEAEELEEFLKQHSRPLDLSLTRRNLVTRGVRLNELVNAEFTVGLCECEVSSFVNHALS
jgi:MOSC domain-containing protein YiiM